MHHYMIASEYALIISFYIGVTHKYTSISGFVRKAESMGNPIKTNFVFDCLCI
jgi:hypothetical protein